MTLTDDQVIRYSRQLLLPGVGGREQGALLEVEVSLEGSGAALADAAAYLVAAGCAVRPAEQQARAPGFLWNPAAGSSPDAAPELNPDAVSQPRTTRACFGEGRFRYDGIGPRVAVGGTSEEGIVVFQAADGCTACFQCSAPESSKLAGPLATWTGTFGALVLLRLLMGQETGGGRLRVSLAPGRREPLTLCPRCAAR
jgi:hypothetical protein